MMHADRTDYITYAVVCALTAVLALLLAGEAMSPRGVRRPSEGVAGGEIDGERIALERFLGHFPPIAADRKNLEAFSAVHPDNSRAHLLLGVLARQEGRLGEAVVRFRRALELNREYADAKSPLYQGEDLGRLVEEGLRVFEREKKLKPQDDHVRAVIKDLYFIRRSLAGGCD